MKAYCELEVRMRDEAVMVRQIFQRFAKSNVAWKFLGKESADYEQAAGRPAVLILSCQAGLPAAAVALARTHNRLNRMCLTNIVPRDCGILTLDEYNGIATAFASDLRRFSRQARLGLQVSCSGGEKGLAEIIPGERTRRLFENYLAGFPESFHACDIEALDCFICAIVQYGCKVDAHEIAGYLMTDLKWRRDKATYVRDRILTGVELLRVHKSFR